MKILIYSWATTIFSTTERVFGHSGRYDRCAQARRRDMSALISGDNIFGNVHTKVKHSSDISIFSYNFSNKIYGPLWSSHRQLCTFV